MVAVIRISPYGSILVLLVALLAGCLDDSGQHRSQTMIERPDHDAGQFWTYSMEGDLGSADWLPADAHDGFTVVATDVEAEATTFGTDSCEMEYHHQSIALFDNRSLQQDPETSGLLDWPLEEGKTWTPSGDDPPLEGQRGGGRDPGDPPAVVRVEKIEDGIAHIVYVDGDGQTRYQARFDAEHGWFSYLHFVGSELTFQLESSGTDYRGSIGEQTTVPILSMNLENGRETRSFAVPEGDALFFQWERRASATGAGAAVFRLEYRAPQQDEYRMLDEEIWYAANGGSSSIYRMNWEYLPSQPGEWDLRVDTMGFIGEINVDHIRFQQDPYPAPSG